LDEHNRQLGQLIEGLKEEKEARKAEDVEIKGRLQSMSHMFFGARMVWALVAALILVGLGGVAGYYIPKWLAPTQRASGG
jgi:cytochrome b